MSAVAALAEDGVLSSDSIAKVRRQVNNAWEALAMDLEAPPPCSSPSTARPRRPVPPEQRAPVQIHAHLLKTLGADQGHYASAAALLFMASESTGLVRAGYGVSSA